MYNVVPLFIHVDSLQPGEGYQFFSVTTSINAKCNFP